MGYEKIVNEDSAMKRWIYKQIVEGPTKHMTQHHYSLLQNINIFDYTDPELENILRNFGSSKKRALDLATDILPQFKKRRLAYETNDNNLNHNLWDKRRQQLVDFINEFNHTNVPLKNKPLGLWVKT